MSDPQPPSPLEHRPAIFNQLGPKDRGYLTQAIKSREKRAKQAAENMASEQTFIAVKPDGVQRGLVGEIISRFEKRGYKLVAMKLISPSREHLEKHYADLSDKPFFKGLVTYMLSGPICAMVWEGREVVKMGRGKPPLPPPFSVQRKRTDDLWQPCSAPRTRCSRPPAPSAATTPSTSAATCATAPTPSTAPRRRSRCGSRTPSS